MRKIALAAIAVLGLSLVGCKSRDARPAVPEDGAVWVNVNNYIYPSAPASTGGTYAVPTQRTAAPNPPPPPPPIPVPCPEPVADNCKDGQCGIPTLNHAGGYTPFQYFYLGGIVALIVSTLAFGVVRIRRAQIRRQRKIRVSLGCVPLAIIAMLVLPGCVWRPATMGDLDQVRADGVDVAKKQNDTFKDHLIANPGDLEGATGKAFGVNVSAQEDLREKRRKENEKVPEPFPYLPVGGGGLGIVGIAWLLIKRAIAKYDAEPFVGPDGRRMDEATVVSGIQKASETRS